MKENLIYKKSFDFAVRIVNLNKYLTGEKREYIMSNQLLRCGTSIGANVSEAVRAQSKADFCFKMNIAFKEAEETNYWIELLHKTEYLTNVQYESMSEDINEIIRILSAILKTGRENEK